MKYFLDTEFLEGTQKRRLLGMELPSWFDTKPTIDLISVGIVCEDGRSYYAVSKEFNLEEAWNRQWIRDNVLKPIYRELHDNVTAYEKTHHWKLSEPFSYDTLKYLLECYGKTREEIAKGVELFVMYPFRDNDNSRTRPHIEFYGYYSDYDWVVLCFSFGKMIDLPVFFPMYCKDLKQMFDDYVDEEHHIQSINGSWKTWSDVSKEIRSLPNYPVNDNSHNALSDAEWNMKLFKFLNHE